jgi:BMFP domain-containing protein YqiC
MTYEQTKQQLAKAREDLKEARAKVAALTAAAKQLKPAKKKSAKKASGWF